MHDLLLFLVENLHQFHIHHINSLQAALDSLAA
jgi:hypothetical protein